jgi:hypothetical protein
MPLRGVQWKFRNPRDDTRTLASRTRRPSCPAHASEFRRRHFIPARHALRIVAWGRAIAFKGPAMRFIVLVFVAFILFSLFSALYFLLKDKGTSTRTVKALTVRVLLSITLFALLLLGFKLGLITQRL